MLKSDKSKELPPAVKKTANSIVNVVVLYSTLPKAYSV